MKTNRCTQSTSLLCMLLMYWIPASAMRPALSGACLSEQSNLVLVGKVRSVSKNPALSDEFGSIHIAMINVLAEIKGEVLIGGKKSDVIFLTTRPDLSEDARLKVGEAYVLYIKHSESGPHIVNGIQGARPMSISEDGKVIDFYRSTAVMDAQEHVSSEDECRQPQ